LSVHSRAEFATITTQAVSAKHLYTLGYEGLDIEQFIVRLRQAGVRAVVDVRELPLSRKKGFSKSALRQRLLDAGLSYFHAPALGCPKPIRNRYREDGDWTAYTREFLGYLLTQQTAVAELAAFARSTPTCLVCYEADFAACHRTYVARAAHRRGGPAVTHLGLKTAVPDGPDRLAA